MSDPADRYRSPVPDPPSDHTETFDADDGHEPEDPLRRLRSASEPDSLFPFEAGPRPIDHWRRLVESIRLRLSPRQSMGAALVVAIVVAVVGLWWWNSTGTGPGASGPSSGPFTAGGTTIPFASASAPSSVAGDGASSGSTAPVPDIVVHAAGAVVNPGVYRLAGTARISDLVAAAGGLTASADTNRINLAQPLGDGIRVYVPSIGEADPPTPALIDEPDSPGGSPGSASGGASPGGGGAGSSATPVEPIDLNTATLDQLDELPGVGPATAQAIVSFRDTNGPFSSVDALLEVRGIGPAKLEQIRPLVRT